MAEFSPTRTHATWKPRVSSAHCCGKPMERIELVDAADVEDRFKLTYQILGGMNNNCINVNWRSIDSTCKPRWFGLKTFTGMQHKYVTPKKWPPVVFALADEDAFAPAPTTSIRQPRSWKRLARPRPKRANSLMHRRSCSKREKRARS